MIVDAEFGGFSEIAVAGYRNVRLGRGNAQTAASRFHRLYAVGAGHDNR
jgi:hypothetical protein